MGQLENASMNILWSKATHVMTTEWTRSNVFNLYIKSLGERKVFIHEQSWKDRK